MRRRTPHLLCSILLHVTTVTATSLCETSLLLDFDSENSASPLAAELLDNEEAASFVQVKTQRLYSNRSRVEIGVDAHSRDANADDEPEGNTAHEHRTVPTRWLANHFVATSPTVDVYVINQVERSDRCLCAAMQLDGVPWNSYWHNASFGNACNLHKNALTTGASYDNRWDIGASGLFCSNFNVWERAARNVLNDSPADFVVILEDDVVLKESWWSELSSILQECDDINYLVVDTFRCESDHSYGVHEASRRCGVRGRHKLFTPLLGRWGTHMQVVRTSVLPELISKARQVGWGPMDHWYQNYAPGGVYLWQPGIVEQAGNCVQIDGGTRTPPPSCNISMMRQSRIELLAETSHRRMECPHISGAASPEGVSPAGAHPAVHRLDEIGPTMPLRSSAGAAQAPGIFAVIGILTAARL